MIWHAADTLLAQYAAGELGDVQTSSVEAHLVACELCRVRVSGYVPVVRLDQAWAGIVDRLDIPVPTLLERCLVALRVPDHIARLLAATPALSTPWLGGMAAALAFVALAGFLSGNPRVVPLFLILAPILPVAGVAVSYGPSFDPVAELAVAAAIDNFRLLLLRSLAVLGVTSLLTGVAATTLPAEGLMSAAWLLPAVALTSATLALGRFIALQAAAGILATAWFVVSVASVSPFRPALTAAFAPFTPFEAPGQIASLVVTVVCAVSLIRPAAPTRAMPRSP